MSKTLELVGVTHVPFKEEEEYAGSFEYLRDKHEHQATGKLITTKQFTDIEQFVRLADFGSVHKGAKQQPGDAKWRKCICDANNHLGRGTRAR